MHKDITGEPLNVGDRVAYATKAKGDKVVQKLGVVLELVQTITYNDRVITKIRVEVDIASHSFGKPKKPVLITNLSNVVKL